MAWQFLLSDLNGNTVGEVQQASSRKVGLPHLRVPSASFNIPIWHSLAPTVMDTDTLLRAYRIDPITGTRTLAFHGPVISAEENADGDAASIAVTAAGPYWRLAKRLIPASKLASGVQYGSDVSFLDLGTIARSVLTDVNGAHFTGIDLGTFAASTSAWAGKWYLKNAAEAIAELGAGLGSFEMRVRPTEATSYASPSGWPRIGLFDVAPLIGGSRPDAIFEYGTDRANTSSYTRSVSRDGLLNQGLVSVSGWPDTIEKTTVTPPAVPADKYHLQTSTDTTSVTARGLFEEVLNDAGVLDDALRKSIGDFAVAIRKNPRQTITFKPVVNARPAPFIDYDVGDTVRARAVVRGTLRFDAMFRIWGVTFDIDENGNESVELELVTP